MRYTRHTPKHSGGEGGSFWLSFSDLMSALMLVFILIVFYCIYQYFDMVEIKTAELLRQSDLLTAQQTELEEKTAELETKDEELTTAQDKLTESETLLLAEQAKLLLRDQELASLSEALEAQKTELEEANEALETQKTELEDAQALLEEQQQLLADAQTLLEDQQLIVASQQEQLDEQQAQLDELVGVRKRIIASLGDALTAAKISAAVDPSTGSIVLDSSILFKTGAYDLSENGKKMIDRFLPVYLNVLFSDDYKSNISEIIIEGHTDSQGDYLSNLALSQNRALAVASYVLSDECTAITNATKTYLRSIITANGRSESQLIYNTDGSENRSASRRVEFKFRLQDEQMIQQMIDLLSDMDSKE